MQIPFLSLRAPVSLSGIGLHTGKAVEVRLLPSERVGLVFVRTDLPQSPEIAASLRHVSHTTHATTLACEGVTVATTEHLLATLWANGVTHCRIEVNGPEIPILDGSALEWQQLLESSGFIEMPGLRPIYHLCDPVEIEIKGARVSGMPLADKFLVSVDVEYGRPYLAKQDFETSITPDTWRDEMAAARTFTLEEWIEPLRSQGLIRGGSPDNAIVLFGDRTSSTLRFPNELARHKALDLIGDLALLFGENGGVLHAHVTAIRAGHELHRQWMNECLERGALIPVFIDN